MIEVICVLGSEKLEQLFCQYGLTGSLNNRHRQPRFLQTEINIFSKRGLMNFWLAYRGKSIVGRIGASIDEDIFNSMLTPKLGFIGFYEAIDDDQVAKALLDTAKYFLRQKGCKKIWGPVDLSIYFNYRFQMDDYASRVFLGEPRNPKYFVEHFKSNGFSEAYHWESHKLDLDSVDRIMKDYEFDYQLSIKLGYRYECFNLVSQEETLERLYDLINKTYKGMPGFVVLSKTDFQQQFVSMNSFIDKNASFFLMNENSKFIGFNIIFKDVTDALHAMKGKMHVWAKLKYMFQRRTGPTANACHTGIEYGAIKRGMLAGIKGWKHPLSLAKSIFYCSAVEVRNKSQYKNVIIALLRSDTPNIHLSREYSSETRRYCLFEYRF